MFRVPDCILVRTSEIALKSPQVEKLMFGKLLKNIHAALREKNIKYEIEINPNRIFIYTKQIVETLPLLKTISGISSYSPAWQCQSYLDEIRLLAVDIAEKVIALKNTESFAIRSRRAGRHDFSSQKVAEEAGAAVKRVTNARVDLSKPDKEINIETRSRKTSIFVERFKGVDGLPMGVSGKILAIINSKQSLAAAFLMIARGCSLVILTTKPELAKNIEKFHAGEPLNIIEAKKIQSVDDIAKSEHAEAIVADNKTKLKTSLLVLRPLVAFKPKKISQFLTQIIG